MNEAVCCEKAVFKGFMECSNHNPSLETLLKEEREKVKGLEKYNSSLADEVLRLGGTINGG